MLWLRRLLAPSSRGWGLIGLAIVNAVLVLLFGERSKLYAPPDAISLQLAFWPSVFASIVVDQWGPAKAQLFVATLWRLDFLFPLAYASFLRGLYVWLSGKLGAPTSTLLGLLAWIAAGLDVVENLLQIHLIGQALAGGTAVGSFRIGVLSMSLCAAAKWALVVVSLLGTVAVLLRSEVAWAIWTCRFGLLSVLLGSLPLMLSAQGQDLLRVVADDALSDAQTLVTYGALLLWATSVWYWSRVLLQIRWQAGEPGGAGERSTAGRRIASWLPRTLGTATLLLAAVACFEASSGVAEPLHGRLVWHAGYCLVLGLAFFYFVKLRRRLLWRLFESPLESARVDSWRELAVSTRSIAWASLAVSGLVLTLFTLAPVSTGWRLGAPAILFLAAANAVFLGSGTVLVGRAYRLRSWCSPWWLRRSSAAPHERRARRGRRAEARRDPEASRRLELVEHAHELVRQLSRRRVAAARFLGEAAFDQPLQRRRQRGGVERRRRIAKDRGDRLGRGAVLERPAPGRHLVEHHSERELVAAVVHLAALRLLGRHVGHRADDRAFLGERPGGGRLVVAARLARARLDAGEPEVEHFGTSVRRDDHVLRLQVAVHDALRVRGSQRVRHLGADRQQALDRQAALQEQRAQALAVDELHHDVVVGRRRPELVDRHDVRVIERGGGLGLELEPRHGTGVAGPGLGQRLERDVALQPRVTRAVDLAHAPGPEGLEDLVHSQASSRGQRQGWLSPKAVAGL